jgi:hypothetical protein
MVMMRGGGESAKGVVALSTDGERINGCVGGIGRAICNDAVRLPPAATLTRGLTCGNAGADTLRYVRGQAEGPHLRRAEESGSVGGGAFG